MEDLDWGDGLECFSSYYAYIKFIGQGSFSRVVKAVDKLTSTVCAVKVIQKHKLTEQVVRDLKQEAEVLAALNHPNIVKCLHLRETKCRVFIAMEYIRGGTLGSLLRKRRLKQSYVVSAFRGLMGAVQYLHRHGVVHRDIKPDNILIPNPRDLSTVKLADFGLCTQLNFNAQTDERCGTIIYMAPEVAAKRHYHKEVDIWSCGIILFVLITGKHPLYRASDTAEDYFIKLRDPRWVFPASFPILAQNLFLNLVKTDPIERYSAKQALNHPWVSENTEIPMTFVEKMRQYEDEVRLRQVVYVLAFACILEPKVLAVPRHPVKRAASNGVERVRSVRRRCPTDKLLLTPI